MNKISSMFRSRRFWAALASVIAVIFNQQMGIAEQDVLLIVGTVSAWIVGDSWRRTE